jgi:hypothetical protein
MKHQINLQFKTTLQRLLLLCVTLFLVSGSYAHEQVKVVVVPLAGDDLRTVYEIGETGPAGGIVFHVTQGGRHGLEAAPVNQSEGVTWCINTDIASIENLATPDVVDPNTGAHNTAAIIATCGTATAAGVASSYEGPNGITTGWYLPNKEELNLLYLQKVAGTVVGFPVGFGIYWSSSEHITDVFAWVQFFDTGAQAADLRVFDYSKVRAVRAF